MIEVKEDEGYKTRLAEILEEEKKVVPVGLGRIIFQIYVYTILIVLMRGG